MAERPTKEERKAANRAELDRLRKQVETELSQQSPPKQYPEMPPEYRKPTEKTEDTIAEVCARITQDETLTSICKDPRMPTAPLWLKWVQNDDDVHERYTRAREQSGHSIYNKIAEMEAELRADVLDDRKFKCLLDSMKWRAGRMHGKYNEKIIIEQRGKQELSIIWHDDTQPPEEGGG